VAVGNIGWVEDTKYAALEMVHERLGEAITVYYYYYSEEEREKWPKLQPVAKMVKLCYVIEEAWTRT
jgi:hypothetical protein